MLIEVVEGNSDSKLLTTLPLLIATNCGNKEASLP